MTGSDLGVLREFLDGGHVDADVFALRPDYRVVLVAVDGLVPGPGDEVSEALLRAAEAAAGEALGGRPAEELAAVAAWREAYRAFGAKPQRTRNSLEALLRRAAAGLPRVNRLTDLYNAVSVLHQIPLGGEDLTRYAGPPRLLRATGTEPFDTAADGVAVVEHPEPGEVVWCDDAGVTCRRWNWRQARRTQLREDTTAALFILDALDPVTDAALQAGPDLGRASDGRSPASCCPARRRSWRAPRWRRRWPGTRSWADGGVPRIVPLDPATDVSGGEIPVPFRHEGAACLLVHDEEPDMADLRQLTLHGEVRDGTFRAERRPGRLG